MNRPTLANALGMTTHISGLLIKAERLGLDADGLERLAIQRGCDYYHEGEPLPPAAITEEQFSDEELVRILQTLDEHLDHAVRFVLYCYFRRD